MALLSGIGAIVKGAGPSNITLDKTTLFAIPSVAASAYFSDATNVEMALITYRAASGQKKNLIFNMADANPVAKLSFSAKAQNVFSITGISLVDFDGGIFNVPTQEIPTGLGIDMNVALLSPIAGLESFASTAGMTQVVQNSFDDNNFLMPDLGFDFKFFGTNYRSSVYFASNTYITFGYGSNQFSALNPLSPGRAIHLGSADNSIQGLYYTPVTVNGVSGYRFRYEGTNSASGWVGQSNIFLQVTFFADQKITVTIGTHHQLGGQAGITDGITNQYQPAITLAENTSYTLSSDSSGNNWVVTSGQYWG